MPRFLSLKTEALVGRGESVVEVAHAEVAALALEVTLVLEGLVDGLTVQGPGGPSMTLTVGSAQGRALVSRVAPNRMRFELGRNQAEYLQAVLLRAVRDGSAETNHLHIEGELAGQQYDLTVMFQVSQPPLSPEEAAKLMAKGPVRQ